jgi:hypothetical protein
MKDGKEWGYWLGDQWIALPRHPLINAGFLEPPFDVERPDGKILHVIARNVVDKPTYSGNHYTSNVFALVRFLPKLAGLISI